jgi:hypothetical protein
MRDFDNLVNQILLEFPMLNKDIGGDLYPKDESGKVIKPDSFPMPDGAKKIGEVNGNSIYFKNETHPTPYSIILVSPQEGVVSLELVGELVDNNPKRFRERQIESSKTNTLKAYELYHYLITKLGFDIVSDNEQTDGGQRIWLTLFKYPDIKFWYTNETKIRDPKVSPLGKWEPIKKSDLKDVSEFWASDSSKRQSSIVLMATKK